MQKKFTTNNILFIIFLCVVIIGISYYKTMNTNIISTSMIKEGYSNLFKANAPSKI